LEPDFSIVYPRKQELKKGRVVKSLPKFYQYVAAAVFLLFALAVSMYKFDSFFKIPQQSAAIKKIPHSHRPDALEQDHKHPVKSAERSSIQKGSTGSEHTLSAPSIFPSKGVSIPSSADNASETNHAPIDLNASENLAVDYVIALPHRLPVFSGIDLLQYPVKQPGVLQNQMVSDATLSPMVMETGNYSDRIARKINDLAGREIVQPGNMKLDYRGAFLALSQLLQGRSLILSHTVKESSEEVAIKLGNLEIGQSFSK
jgi:hypothetical protein